MKILNIATCFDRHEDDVITPWLVEALKHVQAQGHQVDVLTSSYKGLADHVVHGITVFRFRYFPARWEKLTHEETAPDRVRRHPIYLFMVVFYVLSGMLRAWRVARKGRYDVVHVHWPLPHALMGYAAKLACGGRLVCTFHGVSITWVKSQLKFLSFFLKWVLRISDAITVNSSFTGGQVASIGTANVHIIPFGAGMPLEEIAGSPSATEPPGPHRILFVGRLVERKGVRYLVEALPEIRRKLEVAVTIVGDGPLRPELEALATRLGVADIVSFTGVIPTPQLRRLFRETGLFVLPAVVDSMGCTEGLGVVLIEAMSYGKPVVTCGVGGIPDVVVDRETGRLVAPNNAPELAAAVIEILDDPELASSMGEKGRQRAREVFSWDAIALKIQQLYRSLLENTTKPRAV